MLRLVGLVCTLLAVFPAFGQSSSKYQVATITEVKTHQAAGRGVSNAASYDVTVKVGDTIYVVLYTPPLGEETVKYADRARPARACGETYNSLQRHFGPIV
jgi:hypothetical protein